MVIDAEIVDPADVALSVVAGGPDTDRKCVDSRHDMGHACAAVEDFAIQNCGDTAIAVANSGATESTDWTIRRGMVLACAGDGIQFTSNAALNSSGHLVENCIVIGCDDGIYLTGGVGDAEVHNCLILGMSDDGIDVNTAPTAGHPLLVYNCLLMHCAGSGLEATAVADLTENYNNFWGNATNRTNVNAGANSQAYLPLLNMPLLLDGYRFPPPLLGELSEWSPLRRITGTSTPSDDMLGFTRPTTAAKLSWGPLQFRDSERDTGTTYSSSTASLELPDAGQVQFIVPVDAVSTTIQVRVNRQANYAGNNPRMTIREPGQSDRNTVDVGAVSTWNQLEDTFTPTGNTDYVTVILESRNTAAAGNYAVFFDDLFVR